MLSISLSAHASEMLGYLEAGRSSGLILTHHQEGTKLLGLGDPAPLQLKRAFLYCS